jgi:type II secretion system protein N
VKRFFAAGIFFAALFFGVWLIAIPDSLLIALIGNSLEDSGMRFDVIGLKKGLFYNFEAEHVMLKKSNSTLLSIDGAVGKINPFSLIMLKLPVHISGSIGGGRIIGDLDLLGGKNHIDLNIDNVEIEGIPFFGLVGLKGSGLFSGRLTAQSNAGDAKFAVTDLHIGSASFGGLPVPLDMFQSARGALIIRDGTIGVESFSLEGAGIYARIKGEIAGKTLNLVMELMPERSLREKMPVFGLIKNFEVSPGYYSIPIKSTISF